ncbi:MAG TPA: aldehyde dehydrogenase family protein, partial [Steroidobacteraceae bacterium]|nr:aldehyde dehydrogenase family protein [Steroidobacteraceae bacterium]
MSSVAEEAVPASLVELMQQLGRAAVAAAAQLAQAGSDAKNHAVNAAAAALRGAREAILAANAEDMREAQSRALGAAMLDRLALDPKRVEAMAAGLEQVALLPDPIGTVLARWARPNGLTIERVRVPLGVIGIIYESRPNVTADAGALCLKAGNAAILRGGSESLRSSSVIHACLVQGLRAAGLPEAAIQLVPTSDRAAVGQMLAGMQEYLDVLVPRGGKSLVARV